MKKLALLRIIFFVFILNNSCENNPVEMLVVEEEVVVEPVVSVTLPDEVNEDELPQVSVITDDSTMIPDEPKVLGNIDITQFNEELFSSKIGIELRGQTSLLFFPKKQYGFETRDSENQDEDRTILGFPEEEDWILNAPYSDKTLIRNALIYDISRSIGRYTTRVKFLEMTLNGQYDGIYVLMEKLKRDKNRIDLNKLKESENEGEDLTGGYILKIDKGAEIEGVDFFTSQFTPPNRSGNQQVKFIFDTPDYEDITPKQKEYIENYVSEFEGALHGDDFESEELGYKAYIDVDSFIDYFLLNELANNVDGFRLSTWVVKDKNEKLAMGPIWDFNLAFGNANYCGGDRYDVWAYQFNYRCPDDSYLLPFWWERLLQDPNYVSKLKERWAELRANEFSQGVIFERIDNYVAILEESGSVQRNFERWPIIGEYVWPNSFIGTSYESNIDYMKDWITSRLNWLDVNIASL